MNGKTYTQVTATIFAVIGLLHLLRLILGWEAVIGGFVVPVWLSTVALAVAGYLAYSGFKLDK